MRRDVLVQIKSNNRFVPLLIVALVILQLSVPYRGWMILLAGLGGVWLIGYWWARSLAHGLTLTREMRFGWMQVGDNIEERFTLTMQNWVPALWVEILDHSTLPDYQASRVTGVGGSAENSWMLKRTCLHRGVYTLGPTTLRTGDPFGLYTVTIDYSGSTDMMVMPPLVPLPNIQVAPGGRAGEGRRPSQILERTVSASSVREYQPGDSLNQIYWRMVAHRDELYVRLFESMPASDWWIYLDLDEQVQVGEGQETTLEHGIMLAASLADHGLRLGRAVGFIAHSSKLIWLPPQNGPARRMEILRTLTLATPGAVPLQTLLTRTESSLKKRTSLIVITPAVQGDWIPSLLSSRERGIVPTVLVLDPVSFGGAASADPTLRTLEQLQITHVLVTRDWLTRPEAKPGTLGHWEWQITPGGRAISRRSMRRAAWKVLS